MQVYVSRIITNEDAPEFPYIEALVKFYDDVNDPRHGADVTVFLEKNGLPLPEVQALAVRKAREFLERCVSAR